MGHAREHGYPVPRVDEARPDGLVLERIDGPTMGEELARRPWHAAEYATMLAQLHRWLHVIPYEGRRLIHLDLHPLNVLMSPRGPVVIDWTNARSGDPAQDVALTWLICETSAGLRGRLFAHLFQARVGSEIIDRGLPDAIAFRLDDPHVTDPEREMVRRAVRRRAVRARFE
jgi:Ser/Thr protein kinase RdoA (MazF antagonist)